MTRGSAIHAGAACNFRCLVKGDAPEKWTELLYPAWKGTRATLKFWTQIVGKTRLALTPWLNLRAGYVTRNSAGLGELMEITRISHEITFGLNRTAVLAGPNSRSRRRSD